MKLTWFGGTTIRIHIGGAILLVDPAGAPKGIDPAELLSGADAAIAEFGEALPQVDPATWKPRRPARILDEPHESQPVDAWSAGAGSLLIDAPGEAPLLMLSDTAPALGRWAEQAVVVLFGSGERLAEIGRAVLEQRAPRLLALAGDEAGIDHAIAALRGLLDGTALVSLESGLALEV
jgi:hypothetical protein